MTVKELFSEEVNHSINAIRSIPKVFDVEMEPNACWDPLDCFARSNPDQVGMLEEEFASWVRNLETLTTPSRIPVSLALSRGQTPIS